MIQRFRSGARSFVLLSLLFRVMLCSNASVVYAMDGDLDSTFNASVENVGLVSAVAVQSDGKIVIGGSFINVNGTSRHGIARLNADGSLDTSFNPPDVGSVRAMAIQPDGKIVIGGFLSSVDVAARNIARLNTDGSRDTSFNPGSGPNSPVDAIALRPDGKIVIGGSFVNINGAARNRIARLNADGSLDTSFNLGSGADNAVEAIAVQADGKIIIGGLFSGVKRFNADGLLDTSFNPGIGGFSPVSAVIAIALQPDGKIVIGGLFSSVNGVARNSIARLNADGSLDTSFNSLGGGFVAAIKIQPDEKIIVGGSFTVVNGTAPNDVVRLNADGSLDTNFNPGSGSNSSVNEIAIQPDGKIVIGGSFSAANSTARNTIARLNADGSPDTSFNPRVRITGQVKAIAIQPDGKIVVSGAFSNVDGAALNNIARLNADGSLDTFFNAGSGASGFVNAIALQPDGKIVIGGSFTAVNGTAGNSVARLNADGSLDTSFNPRLGAADSSVDAISLQPDGKIILGGSFFSVNGTARNKVARLNADGSLDTSSIQVQGPIALLKRLLCSRTGRSSSVVSFSASTAPGGIASRGSTLTERSTPLSIQAQEPIVLFTR